MDICKEIILGVRSQGISDDHPLSSLEVLFMKKYLHFIKKKNIVIVFKLLLSTK